MGSRKGHWFWGLWAAMTLICVGWIGVLGVDHVGSADQIVGSLAPPPMLIIAGDNQVGQTFTAMRPGLERVDVLLYGYFRRNTEPITFHLQRQGKDEDLFSQVFSGSEVWGWRWKRFTFEPLPESEGQGYLFFFSSPSSTEENGIAPGGAAGDVYGTGTAFFLGVPTAGDIAFRAHYAGVTAPMKLAALAERLVEHKPGVWGDIYFYLLLAALYLLLVVRLGIYVYQRSGVFES